MAYVALIRVLLTLLEETISYHGSVDTPTDGVDTGHQSLKQIHEDRVHCVDTVPGSVNTRPSL
ncbi:hypothetical protein Taro_027583 [Colocasia esculenta]|uniref:Uncharacterized protein n=1 Tax=Colocasia esculenta TaxID=4460 RepID=A0A843VRX8_COLES|nr:hypothetical protein [Colocasia esculenta]